MSPQVHGIHHVTAIAGDPQENLNFYVGVLGLRLVKRSVNQDAPDTYHLFYADAVGAPGTDLTFFPWPAMGAGRAGVGQVMEVAFAIPIGSLAYWQERLAGLGVAVSKTETRFGETALPFADPHGLRLALIASERERPVVSWPQSPVPAAHQLRGIHSVRLWERRLAPTEALLSRQMGFGFLGEEDGWRRYGVGGGGPGQLVEIRELPNERAGAWGVGAVHHVAWRVSDEAEAWHVRGAVASTGLQPTSLIDRFWFKSVYFREPGGVLFELATDGPGFDRDEDMARLGERLILPPWLEPHRPAIETGLPPLQMPEKEDPKGFANL